MVAVDTKKLDKLFDQESKEEYPLSEIEEKPKDLVVKDDKSLDLSLDSLTDEKEFEKYIFEKAGDNITRAEEILDFLKKKLENGMLSERMFEAAATMVNAISTSIAEVNKLKTQKEKFKIDRVRTYIEAMKKKIGEGDGEFEGSVKADKIFIDKSTRQTIVTTREELLKAIKEKEEEEK